MSAHDSSSARPRAPAMHQIVLSGAMVLKIRSTSGAVPLKSENTVTSVLPKLPHYKSDERVETFAELLWDLFCCTTPPTREAPYTQIRGQLAKTNTMQHRKPDLPSKHTGHQDVLNVFLCLITKWAGIQVT
uniref:Uncharacterized protein n=1 Tax=Arundo donax TaxID=35708 RepID=A0A0A9C7U2_ARUDO